MTSIAICDDETQEIERALSLLIKYKQEHPRQELTIHSFSAPLELLLHVAKHGGFDILLLHEAQRGVFAFSNVHRVIRRVNYP